MNRILLAQFSLDWEPGSFLQVHLPVLSFMSALVILAVLINSTHAGWHEQLFINMVGLLFVYTSKSNVLSCEGPLGFIIK